MTNLIIFVVVVVLTILIGEKRKINVGALAMAFAFILGFLFLKMSASAVIAKFPLMLFYNMFIATYFYGFATENGTMEWIARRLMYAFRNAKWAAGLVLYLVSIIVAAMGAGVDATPFIMSPIAFSLAAQIGFSPLLAAVSVWAGCFVGGYVPWGVLSNMVTGLLQTVLPEEVAVSYAYFNITWSAIIFTFMYLLAFIVFKGYKVKSTAMSMEKPAPLNKEQKQSFIIVIVSIFLLVVPPLIQAIAPNPVTAWIATYIKVQTVFAIGVVINSLLRTADPMTVIRSKIPWSGIVMICGMGMMMSLCQEMGIITYLSGITGSGTLPRALIRPIIVTVGAFLSFFVSGTALLPAFLPLMPVLAAATGGVMLPTVYAVLYGMNASSISPYSQGGATALSGCDDEMLRIKLTRQMTLLAIASWIIAVLFAISGLWDIGAKF